MNETMLPSYLTKEQYKFGKVYNMETSLLNYRLHKDQITHNGGIGGKEYWDMVRNKIIEKVMNIQD